MSCCLAQCFTFSSIPQGAQKALWTAHRFFREKRCGFLEVPARNVFYHLRKLAWNPTSSRTRVRYGFVALLVFLREKLKPPIPLRVHQTELESDSVSTAEEVSLFSLVCQADPLSLLGTSSDLLVPIYLKLRLHGWKPSNGMLTLD